MPYVCMHNSTGAEYWLMYILNGWFMHEYLELLKCEFGAFGGAVGCCIVRQKKVAHSAKFSPTHLETLRQKQYFRVVYV